jgi:hypothetical protein
MFNPADKSPHPNDVNQELIPLLWLLHDQKSVLDSNIDQRLYLPRIREHIVRILRHAIWNMPLVL